ncbi:Sensory box histidine kinase/response regulator [Dissulfuribacter thermophilus]|uniref:histidine kinase n=2 Tax=Dissulfuribacter thermophilus TaxID=1156395 RepID=A0A1B9F4G0_9BACT|nr:Sensory box histidine kinase/response regulator [Dissulfuribacter thermophilus]
MVVHSAASPIYDENGELIGALEILRDITERKQMEQALQETAVGLSRANRLKDLLLRMVRHDLGTPIGAILHATEMLLDEPEKLGPIKDDIEDIYQSASHILQLIRDVDVLSSVLNRQQLTFQDVDVAALIKELVSQLEPTFKQAGMKVENLIDQSLPIKGLSILKTVFENILVNAAKYASSGGKLILSAKEDPEYISVFITDFGPGIPDKYKKRIFKQFERLAKDIPGTGLGLAIASQTVALHGGYINVEDNPQGGAIFHVRLPKKPIVWPSSSGSKEQEDIDFPELCRRLSEY